MLRTQRFGHIRLLLTVFAILGIALIPRMPVRGDIPFRVYLTFEDGPTEAYTPELMDILATYNAKATFFVLGYQIKGREAILQRMIREGHAIGNHLWSEPGFYIGAPDDAVRQSYIKAEGAIRAALGPELPRYDAQVKLFRQPAGAAKPFPATPGIQVITYNWNVSSDDCGKYVDFNSPLSFDQQVVMNVLEKSRFKDPAYNNVYDFGDSVVVVFHDINRVTARVLPHVLQDLREAGASFVPLPRPGDLPGTMPISLDDAPSAWPGVSGLTLPARLTDYAVGRAYPSFQGRISIVSIPPNTNVTATGRAHGGWVRVQYNGQEAWVSGAQLRVIGPTHSLPAIKPNGS